MAYNVNAITDSGVSPIPVHTVDGMAPNKPFLNKGLDTIAVYPETGTIDDAVKIASKKWVLLPPEWTTVKIQSAEEANIYMSCTFTTLATA